MYASMTDELEKISYRKHPSSIAARRAVAGVIATGAAIGAGTGWGTADPERRAQAAAAGVPLGAAGGALGAVGGGIAGAGLGRLANRAVRAAGGSHTGSGGPIGAIAGIPLGYLAGAYGGGRLAERVTRKKKDSKKKK